MSATSLPETPSIIPDAYGSTAVHLERISAQLPSIEERRQFESAGLHSLKRQLEEPSEDDGLAVGESYGEISLELAQLPGQVAKVASDPNPLRLAYVGVGMELSRIEQLIPASERRRFELAWIETLMRCLDDLDKTEELFSGESRPLVKLELTQLHQHVKQFAQRLRRLELVQPLNEESYRATLYWMAAQGDGADLALIREELRSPRFPAEDVPSLLREVEKDILKRLHPSPRIMVGGTTRSRSNDDSEFSMLSWLFLVALVLDGIAAVALTTIGVPDRASWGRLLPLLTALLFGVNLYPLGGFAGYWWRKRAEARRRERARRLMEQYPELKRSLDDDITRTLKKWGGRA
jgi:hypothetical protein